MQPCKVPAIQIESSTSMNTLSTCNLLQKHLSSFMMSVLIGAVLLSLAQWLYPWISTCCKVNSCNLSPLLPHWISCYVFRTETQHITAWQTSEAGHSAKCHIICCSISRQREDNVNCFYLLSTTCEIHGKTVMTENFLPVYLNMISL